MTPKERMLRALKREKPDRLPVTIHQWQPYHLETYMNSMDALAAFKHCGLDAAIQYFEAMGQFWIPNAEKYIVQSKQWHEEITVIKNNPNDKLLHHKIITPEGTLSYQTGGNRQTTWITEYLVKKHDDIAMIGGMDQFNILATGTAAQIQNEVRRLFEGFGQNGGYICSASDHFFDTPAENLKTYAATARECLY